MAIGNGKRGKGAGAASAAVAQGVTTACSPPSPRRGTNSKGKRTAPAASGEDLWQRLMLCDDPAGQQATFQDWASFLAGRKVAEPLLKLRRRKGSWPVLWGAPSSAIGEFFAFLGMPGGVRRPMPPAREGHGELEAVRRWLRDELAAPRAGRAADNVWALTTLNWAYEITRLAQRLSADEWAKLLLELLRISRETALGGPASSPWAAQLLTTELPLVLATQLPQLPPCAALAVPAAERLADSLIELTDGEGMLAAAHLPWVWPLFMGWTRCLTLALPGHATRVGKDARLQFEWLVRNALRIVRPDGSFPFADPGDQPDLGLSLPGVKLALRISGDAQDHALARLVLEEKKTAEHRLPPEPGFYSEWSELAVLQCHWSPKQPRWTVDFSGAVIRAELLQRGTRLISGELSTKVRIDGRAVEPAEEWDALCWFSDEDVDFLELELALDDDWVLQRQFFLAREDRFCYLADYLIGPQPAALEYQLELPLAPGVLVPSGGDARELFLTDRRRRLAAVLPLALPEWRDERCEGRLSASSGSSIVLQQAAHGRALAAALFLDLHPRRLQKALTWRQLTVAENLQVVSADTAVAYRVQVGMEQWLFYRSLTPTGNRTALGQNVSSEFMCGRIVEHGEVEHLMEIESE